ncbi:hypothetical protein PLESTB_001234400 [Pleodorina starrii]|uniref:CAAX prenyl protease 2/Lysostaphin resistance protein A-like domain-containing protein n=1 Tax=Pleodorina starrii TaxID=330485 RepID=A0A9W6BTJ4_9CHLO|nr:hypothetical protein PLESTM_000225400 [Pleodorina starrii]GLC57502.1 hypothetical protein PLESTB_001234400 [Pleodorina starrii]GLC63175.1 hypothetical protein PLESTF_000008500 [Pleodorina starrii]
MGTILLPLGAPCRLCSECRRGSRLIAYARKQSKKNSKQQEQQQQPAERSEAARPRIVLEALDQELPQAPSPRSRPLRQQEISSPGEIYPVFAPKPGSPAAADAPWRWDDNDADRRREDEPSTSDPSDVPRWNPRTGFMKTAAELQADAEAAAAAAADAASQGAAARTAAAASTSSRGGAAVDVSLVVPTAPPPTAAAAAEPPLPAVSRNAVLSSALGTGFWMAVIAVFVRNYAALNSAAAMGTDPEAVAALLRWPAGFESLADVGVAGGAAAAVTGARLALLSVWSDLREATDRSNRQILTPLGPFDILLVAAASGIPEELLFRGALLPATFPDWRGVLLAAALFGALHNSGGRNPAFAAWAAAVGGVYGAAFVVTGNVWVPAAAHVAANAASAFIWKARAAEAAAVAAEAGASGGAERLTGTKHQSQK